MAKIVRRNDESIQKMLLFGTNSEDGYDCQKSWDRIEDLTGYNQEQMIVKMLDEKSFDRYLEKELVLRFPREQKD